MANNVETRYFFGDKRFLVIRKKSLEGVVSYQGKVIVPVEYDRVIDCYFEDMNGILYTYVIAEKKDKVHIWLLSSEKNLMNPLVKFECDEIFHHDGFEGFWIIKRGDKSGVVDKEFKVIIPTLYDKIEYELLEGFKVLLNGKWGFIDLDYKIIFKCEFEDIDVLGANIFNVKCDGNLEHFIIVKYE